MHAKADHDIFCCICRTKVSLPLVSPSTFKAPTLPDPASKSTEPASARIADREQPYLANVPLLQESYLFGVADWYSLVTTLLDSHWGSISAAHGPAQHFADALGPGNASEQEFGCSWMSWGWLRQFFQGLNAQHRQVQTPMQMRSTIQ